MNSNLLFDFSVNKENKTIHIKREFDASLELVWRVFSSHLNNLDEFTNPKKQLK